MIVFIIPVALIVLAFTLYIIFNGQSHIVKPTSQEKGKNTTSDASPTTSKDSAKVKSKPIPVNPNNGVKKTEAKVSEVKKNDVKPEEKKAKVNKPEKVEQKKAEPKKAEQKKAEPKKVEPKAEPKKVEAKKASVNKSEKVEQKKTESKKVDQKKAEPKKEEPKKVAKTSYDFEDEVLPIFDPSAQVTETVSKKKRSKKNRFDSNELIAPLSGGVMTAIAPGQELSSSDLSGFTTVGEKKKKQSEDGESKATSTTPAVKRRSLISKTKSISLSSYVTNPYNSETDFWNSEISASAASGETPEVNGEYPIPNFDSLLTKQTSVTIKQYSQVSSYEFSWSSSVDEDVQEGELNESDFPSFGGKA